MDDIQKRLDEIRRIHADLATMPDPPPEYIEALGTEVAELMRDTAAQLSELPHSSTKHTTELALRVLAQLAESMSNLDDSESGE